MTYIKEKQKTFIVLEKKKKDDDQCYGIFKIECDIIEKKLYLNLEGNAIPIYESEDNENIYL